MTWRTSGEIEHARRRRNAEQRIGSRRFATRPLTTLVRVLLARRYPRAPRHPGRREGARRHRHPHRHPTATPAATAEPSRCGSSHTPVLVGLARLGPACGDRSTGPPETAWSRMECVRVALAECSAQIAAGSSERRKETALGNNKSYQHVSYSKNCHQWNTLERSEVQKLYTILFSNFFLSC